MMNFFKKIFALDSRAANKEEILSNKIEFLFDESGEPNVKISIINIDNSDAKGLADLIHSLVTGQYNNDIMDTLLNLSKKDDAIKSFITRVLVHYSLLNTYDVSKSISSAPVIKPSEFQRHKF